jgi:putative transposase
VPQGDGLGGHVLHALQVRDARCPFPFTEAQIVGFLREAASEGPVSQARVLGGQRLPLAKFGGMSVSDAKRLKELEIENGRLKKLLADALLEAR